MRAWEAHPKVCGKVGIQPARMAILSSVAIPVKANTYSGGKPNGIPEEGEQQSERSDAGGMIVTKAFGIVKHSSESGMSGAKRRLGLT